MKKIDIRLSITFTCGYTMEVPDNISEGLNEIYEDYGGDIPFDDIDLSDNVSDATQYILDHTYFDDAMDIQGEITDLKQI